MGVKTITISVDAMINLLQELTEEEKREIFERVFIQKDTEPLSPAEQRSLTKAEQEICTTKSKH
ncbi:hypothetical protein GF339_03075 [candidate division KSB3 bacterium]|uniref:Uncharacterized protein n=1 Tax=candidate division KSB3 bacterium TaxID=2044937 RepID=A0A9D5JSP3_9BACT|nr:hypothetical protein [candidate division KSB3 bacterium]MBD3323538.1 hypothetical protein [candidate division KSB3 bacterium]